MERSEILEMMSALQLTGMRAAYDEIVSIGVKRQHGAERIIGALLQAEIGAKQARSINYQMALAKLPLVKELAELSFTDTPNNGGLIEQLSGGAFLAGQRVVAKRASGTTSCSSTAPARARATSPSASRVASSGPAARPASSTSSC